MITRILCLLLLTTFSTLTLAHPGHDHDSPIAMLVHLLWLAPIGGAFAMVIYARKRKASNTNKQER